MRCDGFEFTVKGRGRGVWWTKPEGENGMQLVSIWMDFILIGAGYGRSLSIRLEDKSRVPCYISLYMSVSIIGRELHVP